VPLQVVHSPFEATDYAGYETFSTLNSLEQMSYR
jgi:hypothetical protein